MDAMNTTELRAARTPEGRPAPRPTGPVPSRPELLEAQGHACAVCADSLRPPERSYLDRAPARQTPALLCCRCHLALKYQPPTVGALQGALTYLDAFEQRRSQGLALTTYKAARRRPRPSGVEAALAAGRCEVCGAQGVSLVVEHEHASDLVRGVACPPCNGLLGFMRDDPHRIRRLLEYVGGGPMG